MSGKTAEIQDKSMHDVLRTIEQLGIVPVVVIENAKDAVPLCRALKDGGLPLAEITFRTAAAEDAIRAVSSELPEVLVGAGTVLTTQQADKAIMAGARFIVSPGLNPAVVKFCQEKGVAVTPGCSTPTEIEMALGLNLDVVKFFPAEAFGGVKTLKAICAPYSMMKFIPTGGINAANLKDYLSFGKVLACGGSWMVKADLIKSGNFNEITRITREAVAIVSSAR
ncbi:MAG: bifunctional 4-hydroxy-2-oxoglutarate aldolase/2-dehydro-3-deoxy-phosphogluconate aldolase [Armatimonadota bacterium]